MSSTLNGPQQIFRCVNTKKPTPMCFNTNLAPILPTIPRISHAKYAVVHHVPTKCRIYVQHVTPHYEHLAFPMSITPPSRTSCCDKPYSFMPRTMLLSIMC
ncbi:hypothetical protein M405DRAFT_835687 [Rhizopogon salebrosus TDB-379]|nr:hypothetical protein M405DRAFT_835687 [Rhizopogon salebrosus TDB-379]